MYYILNINEPIKRGKKMTLKDILKDRKYKIKDGFYKATLTSKGYSEDLSDGTDMLFANNKNRWQKFEFIDKNTKEVFLAFHAALFADVCEMYVGNQRIYLDTSRDVVACIQEEIFSLYDEQQKEKRRKAEERARAKFEHKKEKAYQQLSNLLNPKTK